jgi:ribosome recycling factor
VSNPDIKDIERRMTGAFDTLKTEFGGLRAGRASVSLLEPIVVEAYGANMPLTQVGNVSAPESRMLTVQVWDAGLVTSVEKAIRDSDLGLNPQTEGQVIRVPLPDLTEERRRELVKVAGRYGEQARISVRNVRRDAMDQLKKSEKDAEISKDEHHAWSSDVQKLTDDFIKQIDDALAAKEGEILQV